MQYRINKEENWHTVVHVEIPADQVNPELDARYKELEGGVSLEGFRKGRVPRHLVKKMFGKRVESEVLNNFITDAYDKIFEENEFKAINQPEVRGIKFDRKSSLKFEIHFDIQPEIEVKGYEGMPVEKVVFEITADDVDATLENLRQQNAMIYTVEGAAEMGHIVVADLQELDRTGVPVIGKKVENQEIWLSEENEDVTSKLVGITSGEDRRIVIVREQEPEGLLETNQASGPDETYYLVSAKEVKERKLPELDDEFAKDIGSFKSLKELRKNINDRLKMQAEMEAKLLFERALADELIKRMNFDLPLSMINAYLNALVENVRKNNKEKVDENQIREYYRSSAIRDLKWMLIRRKLIEQQGFDVTDEEMEASLAALEESGNNGKTRAQELRKDKKRLEKYKDDSIDVKIYKFLEKAADITEMKKPWRKADEEEVEAEETIGS